MLTLSPLLEDDDFVLVNSELTFGSGLTGGTQLCVTVSILSDTIVEGNETFTISGSVSPPAVFVPGENMITITIIDYDSKSWWLNCEGHFCLYRHSAHCQITVVLLRE